ncbi:MAG: hypothetical protein ABSC22_07715, partial [Roseiarcus sp.]
GSPPECPLWNCGDHRLRGYVGREADELIVTELADGRRAAHDNQVERRTFAGSWLLDNSRRSLSGQRGQLGATSGNSAI